MSNTKDKVLSGLFWKFGERITAQVVTFVVSLVLARKLATADYGLVSLVMVFITFANALVVNGFGTSLIQKKDADNKDFSTVLWFQIITASCLYALLFATAPLIASFFGEGYELLAPVLRVLGLRIPLTAVNNVQQAFVAKRMIFKKFFFSTIIGTTVSAVVGIWMVYAGCGVWSIVGQYLTNTVMDTLILGLTIHFKPALILSKTRLKTLFSYGWKILVASLISEVYNELRTLIIGKKYSKNDLAFFDQGKKIPQLIVVNINTSIENVLFPAIASVQNNPVDVKNIMRRAIRTSIYILCPLMFGLAAVGEPLVKLILTDKWLPCVPFLRIFCLAYCLEPIQTDNLQAIKAVGRSDIILKLEVIKKGSGLLILLASMNFGVNAIAYSMLLTTILAATVNTFPNRNLIHYSYRELFIDMAPGLALSAVMAGLVYAIGFLPIPLIPLIAIQVVFGGLFYIGVSFLLKLEPFVYLKNTGFDFLKGMLRKKGKQDET